jgi:hypothetical protein
MAAAAVAAVVVSEGVQHNDDCSIVQQRPSMLSTLDQPELQQLS